MTFSLLLDLCNLHSAREDLPVKTFKILGHNPQRDPSSGQRDWKWLVHWFPRSPTAHQKSVGTFIQPYHGSLSPPKFLTFYLMKSSTSCCLDSLGKEAMESLNASHTYRSLKAAEQLSEEGVVAGQGQDPFLRHGALHIVILQDHILLQHLHSI